MKLDYDFKMPVDDDLYFSVFNCHKDDELKANKAYQVVYGIKEYKALRKLIDQKHKGIMGIFKEKPDDKLIVYALLITQTMKRRFK